MLALLLLVTLVQLATALGVAGLVSELFRHLMAAEVPARGLSAMLAGAVAITAGTELVRRLLTEALGLDYARDVRLALFERLLRRPVRGTRARSRGSQLLPFVGDLTALKQWWSDGIARGSSSAIISLGIIAWLFSINGTLGWWMAGLTLIVLALMAAMAGPYFVATRSQRTARGTLTALLSDRIAAAHSIMAMGGVQRELGQTRARIGRMNRASIRRAGWSGAMRGLLAAFPLASIAAIVHLAMGGDRSAGTIPAHAVAGLLTLAGLLGASLADIGRALELAIPARIAGHRLRARMDEIDPIVADAKGAAQRERAVLALDGLALATRAQGFSTRLRAGDVVQLEGPHAGLLIEVLAGMLGPASGQVLICGRSAAGLGQRQRRQWLGVAAPWAPLLQDGLEDNLLLRMRRGAGREELPGLLQALHLAHLLDDQGQVIAQRLRDEEGDGLELRDKAAIRLTRALIGQPRLLLLDRSTRELDAGQIAGLRGLLQGWPGVIVLAGESPEITALATRRWTVSGSRITETISNPGEDRHVAAIHPLHPAGRA